MTRGSFAVSAQAGEHPEFLSAAGLEGACAWRYLTQAVVAGFRPAVTR